MNGSFSRIDVGWIDYLRRGKAQVKPLHHQLRHSTRRRAGRIRRLRRRQLNHLLRRALKNSLTIPRVQRKGELERARVAFAKGSIGIVTALTGRNLTRHNLLTQKPLLNRQLVPSRTLLVPIAFPLNIEFLLSSRRLRFQRRGKE
jgi:hypothetical protein